MHELWLQKYIKEHYRQLGFAQLHGPYAVGADFKGVYAGKRVKVEAEWDYSDYVNHKHSLNFADVLVVATLEPVPERLKAKLPPLILNLNRAEVMEWAQPRAERKKAEDYYAYPWRRLSRNLLYLYAFYQKGNQGKMDFVGSGLVHSMGQNQLPPGFQFEPGGREEGFAGLPQDKALWDFWLEAAHAVAAHFKLKPGLLRLTWIDRVAIYVNHTGRITDYELKRFKDVAEFVDQWILDSR